MNVICVAGQLGKDAELKFLNNGDPVLSFSVADNQGREKPTIWWNCALFGKRAESLAQYLTRGQSVSVSGVVTQREYNDRDGQKKVATEIRVGDVALQGGQRQERAEQPSKEPSQREQAFARQHAASNQRAIPDFNDDVPFAPPFRGKQLFSI